MLFWVWGKEAHRPTRDIDLLGFGDNDVSTLVSDFRVICVVDADDGLVFDLESIKGIEIKQDALYQGVRVTGRAALGNASITFQVDVGFGDAVMPAAERATLPSFLDLPAPEINVYPVQTVIAEKFQAMLMLGETNSRIKDFYDLWVIASELDIEGSLMLKAIKATCARRETALSTDGPTVLDDGFAINEVKSTQWKAFLAKNALASDMSFAELMGKLSVFLKPLYTAAAKKQGFNRTWSAERWFWEYPVIHPSRKQ